MYTLYYIQEACSLAVNTVLRELEQDVTLIRADTHSDFSTVNPAQQVPVLIDGDEKLVEGAAIMLHLTSKHPSHLFPTEPGPVRRRAIEQLLFANATMHPAYSRLFFIARVMQHGTVRQQLFEAAAKGINQLWQQVESQLQSQPFLGGQHASVADILLAVYSRWGAAFEVDIVIPPRTTQMIEAVKHMPGFVAALQAEQAQGA
ncbi:glutathione S-transferase family protein [Pseudoalteromonas ardens]|uniref:glutathione S-transferase family protein n=1 Tax=Pseudoalteromonas ardens TaxID=3048490 RepID=UPI0024C34D39|nr:glutathione S-transferase N-terminal domain-containing protein [Pseudoalteromonas sp. R96]MDK1313366.1 glutathione S-transferase N-terminal domain-containing protein [Pseudoalteromonas sp. R96]